MTFPEHLIRNPHFSRYYRTWQQNPVSIVFVPLAQICREQGLLTEAREICEQGLKYHPGSVSGRLMLARIHFDLDELGHAHEEVEKVLQEFPGQPEAEALLKRIMRGHGAAEAHNEAETISGEPTPLWENVTMARIYADQGDTTTARKILEKILARQPGDERALELRKELTS